MKVSVSIALLSFLYGISSVPINASRICASKKKNVENIYLQQNAHGVEDVSHEIDGLHIQVHDNLSSKRRIFYFKNNIISRLLIIQLIIKNCTVFFFADESSWSHIRNLQQFLLCFMARR